jgi:endonuclease G
MNKFLLLLLLSSNVFANGIDDKCPKVAIWGAPQITKEGNNQYICKSDYAINYDYKTKVAYFVVEHITKDEIAVKSASRKDDFREDTEVPAQYRVTLKDYTGSGLDRGHMAPAADFVSDSKLMSESFFLSNMMPQAPGNNRGIWKSTEERVRAWATKSDVYAITGTHFDKGYKTMGNKVGIPTHVYKIVIQPENKRMIAFWYPNEKLDPKQIAKYVVSVKDIEAKTGIDFSPKIPKDLKPLETIVANYEDWNK